MNWGKSIVLAFALFIAFILWLVIRTVRQDVDLIADDYYAQELQYQDKINAMQNIQPYLDSIIVKRTNDQLQFRFPKPLLAGADGEIYFYRPSSIELDKRFALQADTSGIQNINVSQLSTGKYLIKISWTSGGNAYYFEQDIFI